MTPTEWRKWLDGEYFIAHEDYLQAILADFGAEVAENKLIKDNYYELKNALRVEREHYASLNVNIKALQDQVLELRAAIEKHRQRDWSEKSEPYTSWDEELYAALAPRPSQRHSRKARRSR